MTKKNNQTIENISIVNSSLFNDNNVDYKILLIEKKKKIEKLKIKRQYEIF